MARNTRHAANDLFSIHIDRERDAWRIEVRSPPGNRHATKSLMYAFAPEDGISSRRLVEMLDDLGFEGQLWMVEGDPLVVADERPYDAATISAMWLRRWGVRPLELWLAQHPDIVLERRPEMGTAVRPGGQGAATDVDALVNRCRPAIEKAVASGRTMRMCAFITVMSDGEIDVKVGELKADAEGPIVDRARQIAGPMCLPVLVFDMVRDRTFVTGMAAAPVTS